LDGSNNRLPIHSICAAPALSARKSSTDPCIYQFSRTAEVMSGGKVCADAPRNLLFASHLLGISLRQTHLSLRPVDGPRRSWVISRRPGGLLVRESDSSTPIEA